MWIIANQHLSSRILYNMKGGAHQFSDWGYRKATRIWGDPSILRLPLRSCLCDGHTCPNLVPNITLPNRLKHRIQLGGDLRRSGVRNQIGRTKKFRVPADLIQYLMEWDPITDNHSQSQTILDETEQGS